MARLLPKPPPPAQRRAGPPRPGPLDGSERPVGGGGEAGSFPLPLPPRGIHPASPGPRRSAPSTPVHLLQVGMLFRTCWPLDGSVPLGGLRFFQQLSQVPPTKHSRRVLPLCWDPEDAVLEAVLLRGQPTPNAVWPHPRSARPR